MMDMSEVWESFCPFTSSLFWTTGMHTYEEVAVRIIHECYI